MYGLSKNFDGNFLIGCKLEMVCFNANQVYLHFDKQVTITIEGSFSHERSRVANSHHKVEVPVSKSDLMELLEKFISEVSWNENGTLTLIFDNDHIFECYDAFPNYESYRIQHANEVTIV